MESQERIQQELDSPAGTPGVLQANSGIPMVHHAAAALLPWALAQLSPRYRRWYSMTSRNQQVCPPTKVAGFLACLLIVLGVLTRLHDEDVSRDDGLELSIRVL